MTIHSFSNLESSIIGLWENKNNLSKSDLSPIGTCIEKLDKGEIRVAEKKGNQWIVNEWVKKAILLYFQTQSMALIAGAPSLDSPQSFWYDKVPLKCEGWNEDDFKAAGFRAVPNCTVRYGSYIAPKVVLMPSYVNIGAFVDEGTMVDTWATVGSCAQIGKNCHISGGTGIGGVLEPLQANPVIIEDNCFIGARSEIAEGVIVEKGAVISMGVFISASTKIIDRATGEIIYGRVPANAVVVPGSLPGKEGMPHLNCAVIVKYVDEKTKSKTSINEILRSA